MKELSKKAKFRLEKQKEKRKKKIIIWSIVFIIVIAFSYWSINSIRNAPHFDIPFVDSNDVPSGVIHWHPTLEIIIDGEEIVIPNNIGLTVSRHSPTHTHDEGDGTLHLENNNPKAQPETMSVGYFFYLWKESFNETCILDKCTNIDGGELKMYVDENENYEFENYVFKGEEKIKIIYTSEK